MPYMQISDVILGVNLIGRKVSVTSVNKDGAGLALFWGHSESFRGQSTLRKCLGSRDHLDWLKIDFNAAEIITVQDYNKKILWMGIHIYSIKAKTQAGNIWIKHIMTT